MSYSDIWNHLRTHPHREQFFERMQDWPDLHEWWEDMGELARIGAPELVDAYLAGDIVPEKLRHVIWNHVAEDRPVKPEDVERIMSRSMGG